MKRAAVLILALLVVPACAEDKKDAKEPTKEPAKEKTTAFQKLDLDKAIAKAKSDKKIVMVDFYADWCGPCKKLDAQTFSEEKVQKFLKDKTVPIKVNIEENKKLTAQYKVEGYPCMVFINGEGKEVGRLYDFHSVDEFLDEAKKIVK